MKLGEHVEMVLGTVLEDHDPEKLGRVKVGAPGVFDRKTMSIEAIPWVYPLTMNHLQSFTHMQAGSKVWLIINRENQEEFWWIPYHELNTETKEAINDDVCSDVIFSRNICGKVLQMYQNKEEGIVIKNGTATIVFDNEGAIIGKVEGEGGDAGCFKIQGNNFYCGKDMDSVGGWYKMVKGDILYKILSQLAKDLGELATASESFYTAALVRPFERAAENIMRQLQKLLTERAFVSE